MDKIEMITPLVEIDGDEMTRILWQSIKEILIEPFVELKTEYYDLGLKSREETKDTITMDAARAVEKYKVGVKCATITPDAERVEEYDLTSMWKSPNGTIRQYLDGTTFREPIMTKTIAPVIANWEKPITIARHSYGDVYRNAEISVEGKGIGKLVFEGENGEKTEEIAEFDGPGVLQGIHNKDDSIEGFAHSCFQLALDKKTDLWFSTKDTISKIYDRRFRDIFDEIFEEYKEEFKETNIEYFYTLIDDAIARIVRSEGGILWACKNYDGDVMSDLIASCFGSLAMMSSVLVSPDGCFQYEAAHGTVQRHYYRYLDGEETSTNPVATIFAWSGALKKRGELDNITELSEFAEKLEKATIDTIDEGIITGDLAAMSSAENIQKVNSNDFLKTIASKI